MMKQIYISKKDVASYQQLFHHDNSLFPKTYLLTLWRYFLVDELKEVNHLLVEQLIHSFNDIQLDTYYDVSLSKIDTLEKKQIAFWTYRLSIKKGDVLYAQCDSKIYIQKNSHL